MFDTLIKICGMLREHESAGNQEPFFRVVVSASIANKMMMERSIHVVIFQGTEGINNEKKGRIVERKGEKEK